MPQQGDAAPLKMFDRTPNLNGNQIIAYRASEDNQWFTLIGIAPGDPARPQLVKVGVYQTPQGDSEVVGDKARARLGRVCTVTPLKPRILPPSASHEK